MNHVKGQLIRHPKWGLGKILNVAGDKVTVFFKDLPREEARKILSTKHIQLEVPKNQSDPMLDSLDVKLAESEDIKEYLTHQQAIQKFLGHFPEGFNDRKYLQEERNYKWDAHKLWEEKLNRDEFKRLLDAEDYREAVTRALKIEGKTNLVAIQEKAALHDGVKPFEGARDLAVGLFDLIYGEATFDQRFNGFTDVLDQLPQPKSATLKWPLQTIFPFLAQPGEHLFLKPGATQSAARCRAFSLNYKPRPNWLTYSCLLRFGRILNEDLKELHPRDMIDIQSFIFVTGGTSYP